MEICVRDLRKSYGGIPVLTGVTFAIQTGIACVMAPSGAGKTTLLRILLGLETADSGTVSGGTDCRWAAVFQEDRLLEHLDAMENLRFVLGTDMNEEQACALLEELGLGDVGGKLVRDFSGGMKRRLSLIRALLAPSDALALDEPFTGLDEKNRMRAMACVRRAGMEKPVLLVTHDEADAAELNARIIGL